MQTLFPGRLGKTLLDGRFPSVDQFGNKLLGARAKRAGELVCNGWRAGFEAWCGDWKERSLSHNFVARNYRSKQICDQCDAIQPFARTPQNVMHLLYTNFADDAPWKETIRSHQNYLDATPPSLITPYVEVPGFSITMGCGAHAFAWMWQRCMRKLLMGHRRMVVRILLSSPSEVEGDVMNRFKGAGPVLAVLQGLQLEANCTREAMMNRFGAAFRRWCRIKNEELPPVMWSLHLINRGESDAKSSFPELDSNVKACHTKPILFFLSELASEVHQHVQRASLCSRWPYR